MSDARIQAINRVATDSIAAERLPLEELIPGVHALDIWRDGPNGAMLFWVDPDPEEGGHGEPVLLAVPAKLTDGVWRVVGGASTTCEPVDEVPAGVASGLHRVGGSSQDGVFLTWAFVTPDVGLIRLQDDAGKVRDRPPGRRGRVLLGVTSEDPLTHAYALDLQGRQCSAEPLTLWAPPRD